MKDSEIILKFSSGFLKRKSRERAIFELSSLKKRKNFISKIGRFPEFFNSEIFRRISMGELASFEEISRQTNCYVISGFGNYDGLIMTFSEAVNSQHFGGSGTIIYDFGSNKLIYHEELSKGAPNVYYAFSE